MGGASCTKQTMHEQEANNLVSSLQDACGHDRGTSSLHASAHGGLCTITFDGKLVATATTGKWNCDPFVPGSRRTRPRFLLLLR
jgi:aerobic-type carbon monoxide dehydrogenase small subunit (CoxS/CutS family)